MTVNEVSSQLDDLKKAGLGDREVVLCVQGCAAEIIVLQASPEPDYPVILIGGSDG